VGHSSLGTLLKQIRNRPRRATPARSGALSLRSLVGSLSLLAGLISVSPAQSSNGPSADIVFRDGPVFTAAGGTDQARSVAVRDGRIVAVGSVQDVDKLIGPRTKTIELRGRTLMPGLNETHSGVFAATRRTLNECVFARNHTLESVLRELKTCAAKKPKDRMVQGGLWEHQLIPEMSTLAGLRKLDEASGGRPVILADTYSEGLWVNSRALQLAKIDASTKIEGGEVILDQGKPTGLLMHKAVSLVQELIPTYSPEENRAAAIATVKTVNSVGITGLMEGQASGNMMSAYKQLDASGKVSAWVVAAIGWDPKYGIHGDDYGPSVVERREEFRSAHLFPDAVKLVLDGVPHFRTAVMVDPYLHNPPEDPYFRGDPMIPLPELVGILSQLDQKGIMVKFRAVGDGAVREALDAVEILRAVRGGPLKVQHHIAHAPFVNPKDVPRFAKLGVAIEESPMFWFPSEYIEPTSVQVGKERAQAMFRIHDLNESGAVLAVATAWPAGILDKIEPWNGIEGLITRRDPFHESPATLGADQAIDLRSALELITIRAARVIGLDHRTGSIEPGKSADLILLDRDLFAIKPEAISDTRVQMTMFEGRVVYGAMTSGKAGAKTAVHNN
jgi:predicted amidohydrolase YtcJ